MINDNDVRNLKYHEHEYTIRQSRAQEFKMGGSKKVQIITIVGPRI